MALEINETGVKLVVGAPGKPAPAVPPSPPPPSAAPLPSPPPPPSPSPPPQAGPTIPANMPAWKSWAIFHYVPEIGVKLAVDPDAPEPHAPAPTAGPRPGLASRFVSGCVNRVSAMLKSIRGR